MIEMMIKKFVAQVKAGKVSESQMIKIYKMFKKRDLTDEETEHAKHIAERIQSGELTEEALIEKAKNWSENK